jgi:hypothetical protein
MRKSLVSALALSAVLAGAALCGAAQAQTLGVGLGTPIGQPGVLITPQGSQQGSMASTGGSVDTNGTLGGTADVGANLGVNGGSGIGPGMRGGVGAPTDGLDSNPYAEAPQVRAALGGRINRPARPSGSAPLN